MDRFFINAYYIVNVVDSEHLQSFLFQEPLQIIR